MALMPSFGRFPDEAAIIGELILAYGELEVLLMLCVSAVLNNRARAIEALYRLRGESARAKRGEELTYEQYRAVDLGEVHKETMDALGNCRKIRNRYAHCQWEDRQADGLFFTNLEEDYSSKGKEGDWTHVDLQFLKSQRQYFIYTRELLNYLEDAYKIKVGSLLFPIFSRPERQLPPKPRNLGST